MERLAAELNELKETQASDTDIEQAENATVPEQVYRELDKAPVSALQTKLLLNMAEPLAALCEHIAQQRESGSAQPVMDGLASLEREVLHARLNEKLRKEMAEISEEWSRQTNHELIRDCELNGCTYEMYDALIHGPITTEMSQMLLAMDEPLHFMRDHFFIRSRITDNMAYYTRMMGAIATDYRAGLIGECPNLAHNAARILRNQQEEEATRQGEPGSQEAADTQVPPSGPVLL